MGKETVFICDRCKEKFPLEQNQTHTIPDSCSEVYVKTYDNKKEPRSPVIHAELCKKCSKGILDVVKKYLKG
jgi:hypothetical protein